MEDRRGVGEVNVVLLEIRRCFPWVPFGVVRHHPRICTHVHTVKATAVGTASPASSARDSRLKRLRLMPFVGRGEPPPDGTAVVTRDKFALIPY